MPLILSSAVDTISGGREKRRAWNLTQVDFTLVKALAQGILVVLSLFPSTIIPYRMEICPSILAPSPTSLLGCTDLAMPLYFP